MTPLVPLRILGTFPVGLNSAFQFALIWPSPRRMPAIRACKPAALVSVTSRASIASAQECSVTSMRVKAPAPVALNRVYLSKPASNGIPGSFLLRSRAPNAIADNRLANVLTLALLLGEADCVGERLGSHPSSTDAAVRDHKPDGFKLVFDLADNRPDCLLAAAVQGDRHFAVVDVKLARVVFVGLRALLAFERGIGLADDRSAILDVVAHGQADKPVRPDRAG